MSDLCELCGRTVPDLTKHHLLPRSQHSRLRGRPDFDLEAARQNTVDLCTACHKTVHAELSSRELAESHSTLETLRAHEGIARFVAFARRQSPGKRIVVRRPRKR